MGAEGSANRCEGLALYVDCSVALRCKRVDPRLADFTCLSIWTHSAILNNHVVFSEAVK